MFMVSFQAPPGSSINYTDARFREAEKYVASRPEMLRYFVSVGGFSGGDVNKGIIFVTFKEPKERPVDAKAGCLYPNNARATFEVNARGFDNAIVCDMLGNVAELATSNIFMAKDGVVFTPVANGTFLAGIAVGMIVVVVYACLVRGASEN